MNNLKLKVDYCVLRNILKMHIFNKLKQDFIFFLNIQKHFLHFFMHFMDGSFQNKLEKKMNNGIPF